MKLKKFSLLIVVLVLATIACLCTGTGSLPTSPAATANPVETATSAPQQSGNQPSSSGLITELVTAKDTKGDTKEPVDQTSEFTPSSVIHAVVRIKNAPNNTKFSAAFYVVDVGSAASPNTLILSTDVVAGGTRYIDFNLTPTSKWPVGKYKVEISVNGQVDQEVNYTVQ
jgi:hypothetical protein